MFGRLGFSEILLILALVFVFFGAKKIPEAAKSIAKGLKEFKRELSTKEDDKPDDDPPNSEQKSKEKDI
ncbi:MAG: twin-arginine translocase TatA/TatE family subunit [Candidatus Cloacimonas sp.]|jgi:sec-independent protein translocase protein TatA|nr:twin-arginine translocase TatA/TatE family subunit [Candidatus Cloacimonas sp.]